MNVIKRTKIRQNDNKNLCIKTQITYKCPKNNLEMYAGLRDDATGL